MATTSKLNLENIRRKIRRGKFTVYKHAVEEAMNHENTYLP